MFKALTSSAPGTQVPKPFCQQSVDSFWLSLEALHCCNRSVSSAGTVNKLLNAPNSEAPSGSLLHFCKPLHPLLKHNSFLTICLAYCSHSICSRHIRPSQLFYNCPAATLQLQQVFLTHHDPEGNNPALLQSLVNRKNSKTFT